MTKIDGDLTAELDYEFKVQQQASPEMMETIDMATQATDGALKTFLGANFFVSIFFVGVLQYLWGLVNTL